MEKKGLFSGKCEVCGKVLYANDLKGRSVMVPVTPFYHWTEWDEVICLGFDFECCGKKQRSDYDDIAYNAIMEEYVRKQRRCLEDRLRKELNKRIRWEAWNTCKDILEKLDETLSEILEQ